MASAAQPQIVAILFADVQGYSSTLTEGQRRRYHAVTDPETARILDEHQPLTKKPTGDGVVASFADTRPAANCALDLSTYYRNLDWHELELPRLAIRIALHCGPTSLGTNPISGQPDLVGDTVIEAARTEPVVTPGEVWATDTFIKLLADRNQDGRFAWDDLGERALAKAWGARQLFRLRLATGPPPLERSSRTAASTPPETAHPSGQSATAGQDATVSGWLKHLWRRYDRVIIGGMVAGIFAILAAVIGGIGQGPSPLAAPATITPATAAATATVVHPECTAPQKLDTKVRFFSEQPPV
ncbi:MAG: hypothetical protein CL878_08850, partial [Dehalococcoidia bacterium]|nr:hypothetical protein [Dehalococcoidia bacterium]